MPLIKGPEGLCTWFLRPEVTSAHECLTQAVLMRGVIPTGCTESTWE